MPGREAVPGLSLKEPLPAQGAMMMLSFVCAHTGGGQKGGQLSKQGHDYEPREVVQFSKKTFVPYLVKGF